MESENYKALTSEDLQCLPIDDLRIFWSEAWRLKPHNYLSRQMLVKSLIFKIEEHSSGGLTADQRDNLENLIRAYKRNRLEGLKRQHQIKSGTQLIREWKGKSYAVTIKDGFFYYDDKKFSSLSAIAFAITGTRWNGWVFFGAKNPAGTSKVT